MNKTKQNKLNKGSLRKVLLITAFWLPSSEIHTLVDNRQMASVKMKSPCDIFSIYQLSTTAKADILVSTDFQVKVIATEFYL